MNNLKLLNEAGISVKKKKKTPNKKRKSLSKEYKVFLKKSKTSKPTNSKPTDSKPTESKPTDSKPTDSKPTDSKPTDSKPTDSKPTNSKPPESKPKELKPNKSVNDSKRVKIVKMNKTNNSSSNFVRIINNKDTNKSKNKFTKKSQEKQNKRQSKRKKIHRKITRVKQLSFKCNDNQMNVNKLIKETNKKSNTEIKMELKKKGIDIKSNQNKLLKDLYLFTSCNNINVVRE